MKHFRQPSPSADPLAGYIDIEDTDLVPDDDDEPERCDFCGKGFAVAETPQGWPICQSCMDENAAPQARE